MKHTLTILFALLPSLAFAQSWTWPGDLRSHMQEHGVDPSGKSPDELKAAHDRIHNITQQNTPNPDDYKLLAQGCPTGNCPPGYGGGFGISGGISIGTQRPAVRPQAPRPPPRQARECESWPGGMAKIRVRMERYTDSGSAVCVGYGRERGEWVFLTCSHNLESGGTPEFLIRDEWVPGEVLYRDRLSPVVNGTRTSSGPDRAVVVVRHGGTLRFRKISYDWSSGRVALCGYPGGGGAATICGSAGIIGRLLKARLQTPSRSGFSGGGVFSSRSELVGIWSAGSSGVGYAEPISGFVEVFTHLGWAPGNWPPVDECDPPLTEPEEPPLTDSEPGETQPPLTEPEQPACDCDGQWEAIAELKVQINQINNAVQSIEQGAKGERGPQGEPGMSPTDEQIASAVAAYLAEHPALTTLELQAAVDSWMKANLSVVVNAVLQEIEIPSYSDPEADRHFVVIGEPTARYYNGLERDVESTKSYFDKISLVDPPEDKNVGTLPALVLYVNGIPAVTYRGTSDVDRMLSRIRRGEFN